MWLSAGDKNTQFFHLRASQRRRKNKISKLKKSNGQFTENEDEMGAMATDFYKTLYRSEGTTDMDRVLNTVPVKVTAAMNEGLLAPFEKDEVKIALFPNVSDQGAWARWHASTFFPAPLGIMRR
jgi:hypothetical protein